MQKNTHSLFLVDDKASIRKALERLLRSVGFQVKAYASAEDFLKAGHLCARGCLILDVKMPGMNGLELQEILNQAGSQIKIVFITGLEDKITRKRAMKAGAVAFLLKPFEEEDLLTAVHEALIGRAGGKGQPPWRS